MKKVLQLLTLATLLATSLAAAEIHEAVERGDTAEVQRLLAAGANVDAHNYGWTALHWAARWGLTETAQLLIDRGARIDAQTRVGSTPLHYAAGNSHTEMVQHLIDRGARVDTQDNIGWTPLHYAASNGYTEIARLLKTLPRLNKLLWHAVLNNSLLNARWLLVEGASPHAIALESMFSVTNDTPEDITNYLRAIIARKDSLLHIAVENRNVEMVKLLLAFGGRIDAPNKSGDTPLKLTAGRPEILNIIYKAAEPLPEVS